MSVSLWQADGSQPVREVDVLVVGAGLVGCAAAYFATQAGHHVTITEMRDVALGASSRNAGFVITGLDTYYHTSTEQYGINTVRELWALSAKTHNYWRQFARAGGVQWSDCGSLLLAESKEEAKELEIAARALNADGIAANYHSTDPLRRGYFAAVEQPGDAAVQPYELAWAVFKQSGAELVNNNEMYAIHQEDPEYVTVYTRQYIFKARYVMLCTNAYSPNIDPYFIGKIIPIRNQVIATAPLKDTILETCGYSDYGYMYYRQTFDGRLLIGGARNRDFENERNTSDDRLTDTIQNALEAYLRDKFPEVDAPIERRWAGIMGFTPDKLPMVGILPGKPRVGFAAGFNGHGLAFGAGVAERAVDMLLNGANPGSINAARLDK